MNGVQTGYGRGVAENDRLLIILELMSLLYLLPRCVQTAVSRHSEVFYCLCSGREGLKSGWRENIEAAILSPSL